MDNNYSVENVNRMQWAKKKNLNQNHKIKKKERKILKN